MSALHHNIQPKLAWYAQVIRYFFILLLLATSITKLLDMQGFYQIVDSYQVLPAALIPWSAWALVIVELLLALWLMIGPYLEHTYLGRSLALPCVGLVLIHLMYLVWLSSALVRDLPLDNCGCFGVYWPRSLHWSMLVEDSVLLLLAVILLVNVRRTRG